MKPFDERTDPSLLSFAVLPRLNAQFAGIKEGVRLRAQPAVDSRHGHHRRLRVLSCRTAAPAMRAPPAPPCRLPRQGAAAARAAGRFARRTAAATQQLFVDLDRNKAEVLGVPVSDAFADDAGVLRLADRGTVLAVLAACGG